MARVLREEREEARGALSRSLAALEGVRGALDALAAAKASLEASSERVVPLRSFFERNSYQYGS